MNKFLMSALGILMTLSLMGCVVDPYGYSAYDYDGPTVSTVGVYYDNDDYFYPGYYSPYYYYGYYGNAGHDWHWHDHNGWGGGHGGHGWGGGGHGGHGWGGGGHGGHGHH